MNPLARFLASSIGRKVATALTGLVLLSFLVGHLLGNLLVFQGQDALNSYAEWLREQVAILWVARIGLLTALIAHTFFALSLARENRAARPRRYHRSAHVKANFASRQMVMTGLIILAFVIYHLLHFTFGGIGSENAHHRDPQGRPNVYFMVVKGFQDPWISASYIVAMLLLGTHLLHGTSSLLQTLGINNPRHHDLIQNACKLLVAFIVIGNLSIPILSLLRLVPLGN